MMKFRMKTNVLVLAAICCSAGTLFPTESSARLWDVACRGIYRSCIAKCGASGGREACYAECEDNRNICETAPATTKQQTPPPPCYGAGCPLRNRHPPTTVGQPTPRPRPRKPVTQVNPVSVSNPNNPNGGNNGPVILYRQGHPKH